MGVRDDVHPPRPGWHPLERAHALSVFAARDAGTRALRSVSVRTIREAIMHGILGAVGYVLGLLSAAALALAALIPPILGALAVLLSPIRALFERLRGSAS